MNKKLTCFFIVFSLISALVPCQLFAETESGTYENLYYCIENNEITITGCKNSAVQISVPAEINGYPVTKIYDFAFSDQRSLANIILPDTLTDIGCAPFVSTAFSDNADNYDENGQLYIGNYFIGYKSSGPVCVVKEGTKIIAGGAFYQYSNNVKEVILPDSVITIGALAFGKSTVEKINLPDGLKYIKERAFDCQDLKEIYIPKSVAEIENEALVGILQSISVSEQNGHYSSWNGVLYNKDKTKLLSIPLEKTYTFVPISVTHISGLGPSFHRKGGIDFCYEGSEAEWNKIEIDEESMEIIQDAVIYFNRSAPPLPTDTRYSGTCGSNLIWTMDYTGTLHIKGTGEMAITEDFFLMHNGISSIIYHAVIEEGVTGICDWAFCGCHYLENIRIPKSVTTIGEEAFAYCRDLKDVYYAGSEEDWKKINIGEDNDVLQEATIHFLNGTVNISGLAESVLMQNNTYDGEIIIALYDANDRLLNIKTYEPEENITAVLPENISYKTAKVMWWKNMSSIQPVCKAKVIAAK